MKYYPIYLDLRERSCLIVGGGPVAERKAVALLEAGAQVTVVSPSLSGKLQELSLSGKITHIEKMFEEKHLGGAYLVIAATDSRDVNIGIAHLCRKRQMLVNVASPPEQSTFIVPSVVDRGDLLIAISTGGSSPALSKKIRQELEERYGPEHEIFLQKMAAVRNRLIESVHDESARKAVFQALLESDVLELLRQGKAREADHRIAEITGLKER